MLYISLSVFQKIYKLSKIEYLEVNSENFPKFASPKILAFSKIIVWNLTLQ
jgi:hypothetical protein